MAHTRFGHGGWLSGKTLFGNAGFGVRGDALAASGDAGAGYLFDDISLPADAAKEIAGRILTWPSAGTLAANEDGSFSFLGAPDGIYTFTYQLYVDGIATGSPATVTLQIGIVDTTLTPAAAILTFANPTASLTRTGHLALAPAAANLVVTTTAAVLTRSGALILTPAAAVLTIATTTAALSRSGVVDLAPAAAVLTLTSTPAVLSISAIQPQNVVLTPAASVLTFVSTPAALRVDGPVSLSPAAAVLTVTTHASVVTIFTPLVIPSVTLAVQLTRQGPLEVTVVRLPRLTVLRG